MAVYLVNEAALRLTDEQVDAIWNAREIWNAIRGEVQYASSGEPTLDDIRAGLLNATNVAHEGDVWAITDLDSGGWEYRWDRSTKSWRKHT